jgi:hypothetical protein
MVGELHVVQDGVRCPRVLQHNCPAIYLFSSVVKVHLPPEEGSQYGWFDTLLWRDVRHRGGWY